MYNLGRCHGNPFLVQGFTFIRDRYFMVNCRGTSWAVASWSCTRIGSTNKTGRSCVVLGCYNYSCLYVCCMIITTALLHKLINPIKGIEYLYTWLSLEWFWYILLFTHIIKTNDKATLLSVQWRHHTQNIHATRLGKILNERFNYLVFF